MATTQSAEISARYLQLQAEGIAPTAAYEQALREEGAVGVRGGKSDRSKANFVPGPEGGTGLSVFAGAWACVPAYLESAFSCAQTAFASGQMPNHTQLVSVAPHRRKVGGKLVSVVPVGGALVKHADPLLSALGLVQSTERLALDFLAARDDADTVGVLLDIESPGGSVDGPFALADLVFNSRGRKPIIAFCDGLACSAAYLVAAAADRIVATQTAEVGSIGIVAMHTDRTGEHAMQGLKHTIISAGEHKAQGQYGTALSDGARAEIQRNLDDLHRLFMNKVALFRRHPIEGVREEWGTGRVWPAAAAPSGMIDVLGERGVALKLASGGG